MSFSVLCSALVLALVAQSAHAAVVGSRDTGLPDTDTHFMTYTKTTLVKSLLEQLDACPALPPRTPPTHVNDVRPDDISVVIGMGDSVIAGLNTRFVYDDFFGDPTNRNDVPMTEFRGTSFVNGNDTDAFSIGKIISSLRKKQGRSDVYGLANGAHPVAICFGPLCRAGSASAPFVPEIAGLNAAQSGSWVSQGNINNQFKYLDTYYDSMVPAQQPEPWKLVMYDPGFNNLCFVCSSFANWLQFSADIYEQNVRYMLEEVRSRYSNTIVMLLGPFDITQVHRIISADPVCSKINSGSFQACFCLFYKPEESGPKISQMAIEYNNRLAKIAYEYKLKNYTDFGVVYEAGFGQADSSSTNILTDLSGYDCYHPTVYSHARNAANLWNNIFLKQDDKKPYKLLKEIEFKCPKESDRIILD